MESLENLFEKQYSLESIDSMTLGKRDYILQGLLMLEVITHEKEWEAGYYYEKDIPGEQRNTELNVKKFLARLYTLEENSTSESNIEGLIRNLPGDISLLKLDSDHYIIFEHSELNYDNKVRKLRLIDKEEFKGVKKVLFEQTEHKIQSLKNMILLHESNAEKLSQF